MVFWASTEVHQPAYAMVRAVRLLVEPYLNEAFSQSGLAGLKVKLRYIPIIMPVGMQKRYPERSKVRRKEAIVDCAPQLDYDLFVEGNLNLCLREYFRGIAQSAPHLAELRATPRQIEEFERIISEAPQAILAHQNKQLLH